MHRWPATTGPSTPGAKGRIDRSVPGRGYRVGIGAVYPPAARDREPVALHRVPRACVDAVLLVEDRRFFEHVGLDPRRVVGAALANLRAGRVVEGGSTIPQQLVKKLYLTRERSFARKWKEATLALRLERSTGKPEILQAYLNEVYLGQRGSVAVHGFGAGARHWFGRDVSELGVSECAWLAGLIRGPSLYAPWRSAIACWGCCSTPGVSAKRPTWPPPGRHCPPLRGTSPSGDSSSMPCAASCASGTRRESFRAGACGW